MWRQSAGNLFAAITLGQGQNGVFKWKADDVQHRPDGYSCIEMADDAKLDEVFDVSGPIEVKEADGDIKMTAAEGRAFPSAVLKGCPLTKVYGAFRLCDDVQIVFLRKVCCKMCEVAMI